MSSQSHTAPGPDLAAEPSSDTIVAPGGDFARASDMESGETNEATPGLNEKEDMDAEFGPAPDGGLEAWLVALGAGCVTFAALGFSNSFGVFQEYYMTHQLKDKSADTISWIGSCTGFFQFVAGVFAGPLFDRYGAWMIRPAAIICVFSVMMTSLAKEYYQFLLAQGILLGLATGTIQLPAFAAVSQFFDKKRAAALGMAVAGSSIGGVVFPIATSKMLNSPSDNLSFGWSVRILGFIMLAALTVTVLTVKPRLPRRTTTLFIPSALRQPDYVLLILAMALLFLGLFTPIFFLPSYAVSRGMDATLASYLLAILNGASTFGRIVPGILADKVGRINALVFGGISTGICIFCMTKATGTAGLVVFAVFFGFCSGTIISGSMAALTVCVKDMRNMGTYLGQAMGIASIAILIGPPINASLLKTYGSYLPSSLLSGSANIAGAAVAFGAKYFTEAGLFGRT